MTTTNDRAPLSREEIKVLLRFPPKPPSIYPGETTEDEYAQYVHDVSGLLQLLTDAVLGVRYCECGSRLSPLTEECTDPEWHDLCGLEPLQPTLTSPGPTQDQPKQSARSAISGPSGINKESK